MLQYSLLILIALASSSTAVSAMALTLTFPSCPLPKLVMLDRDGVINQDVGSPGVVRKDQFQLTPGAANAIGTLKRNGCHVVIVTNQSCVGKGLLTTSELRKIHEEMERLLVEQDSCAVIDRIYVCTSTVDDENNDPRKKPNPGMIIEACSDFQVDPSDSVFVGDTLTDLQAAKAGGIKQRILVETGYGFGLMGNTPASIPAKVLEETDLLDNVTNDVGASTEHLTLAGVVPFLYAANLAQAVGSIVGE